MKVAYLANYKDVTGYSYAALSYIKALATTDIDLATRHTPLYGRSRDFPIEQENNNLEDIDICIQHTLPAFYQRTRAKKNVGYFAWETTVLPKDWSEKINSEMDAVIVHNKEEKNLFSKQLNVPVYNIRHAVEIPNFDVSRFIRLPELEESHVFYTIGSDNSRKNLEGLIMAYLSEFNSFEKCFLFIHIPAGDNEQGTIESIGGMVDTIKKVLKLENYSKIILNVRSLSDESMLLLHNTGDTYCSISKGESWGIPAHNAAMLSKNLILSKCNGYSEFGKKRAMFVKSSLTPCFKVDSMNEDLYTGEGEWYLASISDTKSKMRHCYKEGKRPTKYLKKYSEEYTYESVGRDFYKILREINV